MLKPRVHRTGVNKGGCPQLVYAAQSLEIPGIDKLLHALIHGYKAVKGIAIVLLHKQSSTLRS